MKSLRITMTGLVLALVAAQAVSHHSFAMFDQSQRITLKGKVTEFQWTNPHAFIEVDVVVGGKLQRWSIELNSPNNLKRQGWSRNALKPGDHIVLRANPLRDGKTGGLFLDVVLPNGKVLDSGMPKDGTPVNVPQV